MNSSSKPIYPWLQPYWEQLSRYLQQDRLPSALMLVGDKGLGLSGLAKSFANLSLCTTPSQSGHACGVCESCVLFNAGNYPDFFHLEPEEGKTSIKIDVIRQLSASLALSAQYTKTRVVIIDPADAMLHQASNSLLKTLEEPSENTCLILIAHQASKIPITIRSRCQLVTVNNIDLAGAQAWLQELGCPSAEQYLNLASGFPLLAHDLWKKDALDIRSALFKDFLSLIAGRLDPLLFAEKCISLKGMPVLKWIMTWLTDAIKYAHGSNGLELMNADLLAGLKVIAGKLHLKNIHNLLDGLVRLSGLEYSQVNQQLMLEEFAIQCYSLTVK